jgi:hypothetical protein
MAPPRCTHPLAPVALFATPEGEREPCATDMQRALVRGRCNATGMQRAMQRDAEEQAILLCDRLWKHTPREHNLAIFPPPSPKPRGSGPGQGLLVVSAAPALLWPCWGLSVDCPFSSAFRQRIFACERGICRGRVTLAESRLRNRSEASVVGKLGPARRDRSANTPTRSRSNAQPPMAFRPAEWHATRNLWMFDHTPTF